MGTPKMKNFVVTAEYSERTITITVNKKFKAKLPAFQEFLEKFCSQVILLENTSEYEFTAILSVLVIEKQDTITHINNFATILFFDVEEYLTFPKFEYGEIFKKECLNNVPSNS